MITLSDRTDQTVISPALEPSGHQLARLVLVWFVFTFIAARVLVLLIMLRKLPDLFLHMGQTHVHHLNYGIFLLAGIGAFLLFKRPTGRQLPFCATVYAVGLALTFDEFVILTTAQPRVSNSPIDCFLDKRPLRKRLTVCVDTQLFS